MTTLTGRFDGKVIVPDEPVDLPLETQLIIHVHPAGDSTLTGTSGDDLVNLARQLQFDPKDVAAMASAIEQECERIDPDGW